MKRFMSLPFVLIAIIVVFGTRYYLHRIFGLNIPNILYAAVLMVVFTQIAKKFGVFAKKNRSAP